MSSLRRSASTKSSWRIFLNPDPYLAELRGFPSLHCGPEVQKASPSDDHRAHFICLPSFRDQFCLTYFQHLKTLYIFLSSFLAYVGRASLVSFISAWAEAEVRQPVVSFSDSYLWVVALLFYRAGKGGRKRGWDTLMCKRNVSDCPPHAPNGGLAHNPGMCSDRSRTGSPLVHRLTHSIQWAAPAKAEWWLVKNKFKPDWYGVFCLLFFRNYFDNC